MKTTIRHHSGLRRAIAAIAGSVLLAGSFAASVSAAAPGNDDIGSPRVVGAIPYSDGPYDTTESTTGATDPTACFGEPDRSTVWYSFSPAASGEYAADTFGSDYDTTLYVGTSDGAGGINVIDCNDDAGGFQSLVRWNAEAGTAYLLMVGTCCGGGVVGQAGGGGTLEFHVNVAPPAPTVSLTIAGTGSFTSYGTAIVQGTVDCANANFVNIDVDGTQRVGRFFIRGFGNVKIDDCSAGMPWSVEIASEDGNYLGGSLQVNAFAFACSIDECADDFQSHTVRLRR
jgi:hypothetical protein